MKSRKAVCPTDPSVCHSCKSYVISRGGGLFLRKTFRLHILRVHSISDEDLSALRNTYSNGVNALEVLCHGGMD